MVIHYAEELLSKLNGGSPAGWPNASRIDEIRVRLGSWIKSMENEQAKWSKEVTEAANLKQVQVERFLKKVADKVKAGFLSEQAKAEAQEYAKGCLDDNESKHCHLEIPECWEEAFKRLQMVRKEQREQLIFRRNQEIKDAKAKAEDAKAKSEAAEANA